MRDDPGRHRCRGSAGTAGAGVDGLPARLLPVALSVAGMGVMTVVFASGGAAGRQPAFLAFPAAMLVSTVAAALIGRSRRGAADSTPIAAGIWNT